MDESPAGSRNSFPSLAAESQDSSLTFDLHVSSRLQTLHKSCSRGECYVVDCEVITSGIPYQDYFYTVHRYCLTSVNKHKSRLRWVRLLCHTNTKYTNCPLKLSDIRILSHHFNPTVLLLFTTNVKMLSSLCCRFCPVSRRLACFLFLRLLVSTEVLAYLETHRADH